MTAPNRAASSLVGIVRPGLAGLGPGNRLTWMNQAFRSCFGGSRPYLVKGIELKDLFIYAVAQGDLAPEKGANPTRFRSVAKSLENGEIATFERRDASLIGFCLARSQEADLLVGLDLVQFKQREEILRTTLDHLTQGVSLIDERFRFLAWNQRFLDLLDLPNDLVEVGHPFEDVLRYLAGRGEYGSGDPDEAVEDRMMLMRDDEVKRFERTRPDGRTIEVCNTQMANGGIVSTYADITDYKRSQQILETSAAFLERRVEERTRELDDKRTLLETVLDSMSDGIGVFDPGLRLVLWNRRWDEIFHMPGTVMKAGVPFADLVRYSYARGDLGDAPEEEVVAARVASISENRPTTSDLRWTDGTVLRVHHHPLPDGGFLRAYSDVTQQVQVEEAQRQVLDTISFPVIVTHLADDGILYLNRPAATLFGLNPEAAHCVHAFHVSEAARRQALALLQRDGQVDHFECQLRAANDRPLWVELSLRKIRYRREEALLTCVSVIEERKRAEHAMQAAKEEAEAALCELKETQSQLIQAEKMAALGSLVAGVAHEINTPVGIALTGTTLLGEKLGDLRAKLESKQLRRADMMVFFETAEEAIDLLQSNIERASELIHSFKQVAVDQTSGDRRRFNCLEYIHELLRSLSVRLRRAAHVVSIDCPADLTLETYPGALSQVLTNLIMNALVHAYAPGQKGRIDIVVRDVGAGEVELCFADDGQGIPPQNLGRVFEPFFTTARATGGTGLGLHIVYNLVHRTLRGRIDVTSEPGRGTRFTIRLPKITGDPITPSLAWDI